MKWQNWNAIRMCVLRVSESFTTRRGAEGGRRHLPLPLLSPDPASRVDVSPIRPGSLFAMSPVFVATATVPLASNATTPHMPCRKYSSTSQLATPVFIPSQVLENIPSSAPGRRSSSCPASRHAKTSPSFRTADSDPAHSTWLDSTRNCPRAPYTFQWPLPLRLPQVISEIRSPQQRVAVQLLLFWQEVRG